MKKNHRLAAHISNLDEPLKEYCRNHGITASEAVRRALCLLLKWEELPAEPDAYPEFRKQVDK